MPLQPTFVTQLLQLYHCSNQLGARRINLPTMAQAKYLCDVGLGPIAFKLYGNDLKNSDPAVCSKFRSADLTTRLIYGQIEKAAVELASELHSAGIVPTLLKGISASDEFYEPPYLRLMGDIDILVRDPEVDIVMAKVADLGYEITNKQWRMHEKRGHHHLPAARHPETGMTIEVHTGLFGPAEFYADEPIFRPENIVAQRVEFDYRGSPIARFTPEFQFIFTVSKWSVDEGWAVNLKHINDVIHILRKYEENFDWSILSEWFASSPHLSPIVTALLRYLEETGVYTASAELRNLIADTGQVTGPRTLTLLMRLMHTYPFNAREKVYGRYARWCAHSLWLSLSRPNNQDFKIPIGIFRALLRCANYGRFNPIQIVSFRLQPLLSRSGRNRSTR